MSWVDGTRWDRGRGAELVKLLINQYPLPKNTVDLLVELGIDRDIYPEGGENAGARWVELARAMHEAHVLRAVVEHVAAQRPVLAARLTELAADPPGTADGNPSDEYHVHLLFGRRPLIDRNDLREALRRFLDQQMPLFVIRGAPQTGKSFSLELVRHVTTCRPGLVSYNVDFTSVASGNAAAALVAHLCRRLDVQEIAELDDPTTLRRQATDLVDIFIGRYINKYTDGKQRLLVIDGLNRPDLDTDVGQAMSHLAVEVIKGNLPSTQLVLTGYGQTLDPELDYGYVTEDTQVITAAHVRFFFEHLQLPQPLPPDRVTDLVARAQVGQGNLKTLGSRVRDLAIEVLGAP